uniref:RdRp n=1 Tax=Atrato Partiti-like virus 2 TaxID=2689327 RepID=A0A6B9KNZ9_9VIRU|nr:RdRp [Atrato Partiti-like virus 2]
MSSLHRSTITYESMVEDLYAYDREPARCVRDDVYYAVLNSIREDFQSFPTIVPLTMGAVPQRPDFPGQKSPGLPYKLQGFRTKQDVIDAGLLHEINRDWQNIGFKKRRVDLPDVCLFARAQIAREGREKIRATWGYPISVYIEEGRFFYPIQDTIKARKHDFPIAYGFEMAHGGMRVINELLGRNPGAKYLCLDWKQFDKTVPPWVIRDAFSILAEKIDWGHVEDVEGNIWPVAPEPSKRRWKRMVDYFINTPIRTCKGERFLVSTGVPSGSCWTNLIDSIVNALYVRYAVYQTTGSLPLDEMYLGDDGVVIASGVINLKDMAEVCSEKFGAILNVDKSFVTTRKENVHFLGYFNQAGYPFKNQDFLIASFIQPEHTRKDALDACAAGLGQLWSGFDPCYANTWRKIILDVAAKDDLSLCQVVTHLRSNSHRHKYLMHVGLDARTLTIPAPNEDGLILDVLPSLFLGKIPRRRRYNLATLFN